MLTLKNARYYAPDGHFKNGDIVIDGTRICPAGTAPAGEILDAGGYCVIPGLIDIHTHGAVGIDTMSADKKAFEKLSAFYASHGVTTFMPTTITCTAADLRETLKKIKNASESRKLAAAIAGAHVEGPYINKKYKGCHDKTLICTPQEGDCADFLKILGKDLKLRVTIAPEIAGAHNFIRFLCQNGGSATLGHSDAVYSECNDALSLGANSFTHLFNAMRGLHHREPGTVGAALLSDAYVELICDGVHLHPDIIKLVNKVKSKDRIILITDSMCATGMKDGSCFFGGTDIIVKSSIARTEDGTLAGSTLLLIDGLKNFMRFTGTSLESALPLATINPAKAIGIDGVTGTIEAGKRADLVVADKNLNVAATVCAGRVVYRAGK